MAPSDSAALPSQNIRIPNTHMLVPVFYFLSLQHIKMKQDNHMVFSKKKKAINSSNYTGKSWTLSNKKKMKMKSWSNPKFEMILRCWLSSDGRGRKKWSIKSSSNGTKSRQYAIRIGVENIENTKKKKSKNLEKKWFQKNRKDWSETRRNAWREAAERRTGAWGARDRATLSPPGHPPSTEPS